MNKQKHQHSKSGFNKPFAQHFQQRQASGSSQGHPRERSIDEVWGGSYLQNGYFDENGNLLEELVRRDKLTPLIEAMINSQPKLTSSQLRRFFQHCRAIETRILSQTSGWEKQKAEFLKLDAAAADAYGKQEKKIPKLFHDFIQRNVAAVKTEKDFMEGFLKHFEALVGFATQYLEKERR